MTNRKCCYNRFLFCVFTFRQHQLLFCDTVIERNRRSVLSVEGNAALDNVNPLDSFFPFDPYLLSRYGFCIFFYKIIVSFRVGCIPFLNTFPFIKTFDIMWLESECISTDIGQSYCNSGHIADNL